MNSLSNHALNPIGFVFRFVRDALAGVIGKVQQFVQPLFSCLRNQKQNPDSLPLQKKKVENQTGKRETKLLNVNEIKNTQSLASNPENNEALQVPTKSKTPPIKQAVRFNGYPSIHKDEHKVQYAAPLESPSEEKTKVKSKKKRRKTKKTHTKNKISQKPETKQKIDPVIRNLIERLSTQEARESEGIFRVSGKVDDIDKLDLRNLPENVDINVLACKFKRYIGQNLRIFDSKKMLFIASSPNKNEAWKDVLKKLTEKERENLQEIIRFLAKKIVPNSKINRMNAENLAMTICQQFVKEEKIPLEQQLQALEDQKIVFKALIENFDKIF